MVWYDMVLIWFDMTWFWCDLIGLGLWLWAAISNKSRCIVYSIVTGRSGFDPIQRQMSFPLASVPRPALGPTQPPIQWVPVVLPPELKRGRGVTLTTHPHRVPRSWMSRSYILSPPSASIACGTALASVLASSYFLPVALNYSPAEGNKSIDTEHCEILLVTLRLPFIIVCAVDFFEFPFPSL
jgi:hypothetical protein